MPAVAFAILAGHQHVAKSLVEAGVNPNPRCGGGRALL